MKKTVKTLLSLALAILGAFTLFSCGESAKVTGLEVDFFEASWDAAVGAVEYAVIINDTEYRTENTYFELYEYVKPGKTVEISVEAIYGGDERRGNLETVEYTAEEVTEGLVFTAREDGTYSVYCPADKIPENGEVVLPDTYDGYLISRLTDDKKQMSLPIGTSGSYGSKYEGTELTAINKIRLPAECASIGKGALYKSSIKSIYIPETVTTVEEAAFLECADLERVSGGKGITEIHNYAFSKCSSLSDFTFRESLVDLGTGSFSETAIKEVSLPKIERFCDYTFYGCSSLEKISLAENVGTIYIGDFLNTGWYNSQPDGILYLGNILYGYKGEMPENTELAVKCEITNMVQQDLFKDQKNLISITLPEGITEITRSAFEGCENLHTVNLPEGLLRIGINAFRNCSNLKAIELPDSLTSISAGSFSATGLESVRLPEGFGFIGRGYPPGGKADEPGAFADCKSLTEVVIPKTTRVIGDYAFYRCTALTKITIEDGVEEISYDVFVGCSSLTELVIPDSVKQFFFHSIAYSGIKHFVFPKNIEFIHSYSQQHKDGILLDYIVIQNGTKLLDYNWFYVYSSLKTFYFEGTEEEYGKIVKHNDPDYFQGSGAGNVSDAKRKLIAAWFEELDVCYYSEEAPTGEGSYWRYVDGVPTKW